MSLLGLHRLRVVQSFRVVNPVCPALEYGGRVGDTTHQNCFRISGGTTRAHRGRSPEVGRPRVMFRSVTATVGHATGLCLRRCRARLICVFTGIRSIVDTTPSPPIEHTCCYHQPCSSRCRPPRSHWQLPDTHPRHNTSRVFLRLRVGFPSCARRSRLQTRLRLRLLLHLWPPKPQWLLRRRSLIWRTPLPGIRTAAFPYTPTSGPQEQKRRY
jgi:hypothetical protein